MKLSRRGFLQITGLAILGIAAKPALHMLSALSTQKAPTAEKGAQKSWAMVVNLKACPVECRDCIDACHRSHNVPDFGNPKDEIKWIWRVPFEKAFPEQEFEFTQEGLRGRPTVVFCNHCANPPCTQVCPTGATWRREDGIVLTDFHRCIGCRYCMAACPYGSRSFNWRDPRPYIQEIDPDFPTRTKGVVEKCNFCSERLAQDLLPLCVEACKEKALIFGDLEDHNSKVRKALALHYTIRRRPGLGTQPKVYYIV